MGGVKLLEDKGSVCCQESRSLLVPLGFNHHLFHSPLHSRSSQSEKMHLPFYIQGNKVNLLKKHVNFRSLIELMDVEFGKVLGYDFTGCKEDVTRKIERNGEQVGLFINLCGMKYQRKRG